MLWKEVSLISSSLMATLPCCSPYLISVRERLPGYCNKLIALIIIDFPALFSPIKTFIFRSNAISVVSSNALMFSIVTLETHIIYSFLQRGKLSQQYTAMYHKDTNMTPEITPYQPVTQYRACFLRHEPQRFVRMLPPEAAERQQEKYHDASGIITNEQLV